MEKYYKMETKSIVLLGALGLGAFLLMNQSKATQQPFADSGSGFPNQTKGYDDSMNTINYNITFPDVPTGTSQLSKKSVSNPTSQPTSFLTDSTIAGSNYSVPKDSTGTNLFPQTFSSTAQTKKANIPVTTGMLNQMNMINAVANPQPATSKKQTQFEKYTSTPNQSIAK